jgi:hypothetical protein
MSGFSFSCLLGDPHRWFFPDRPQDEEFSLSPWLFVSPFFPVESLEGPDLHGFIRIHGGGCIIPGGFPSSFTGSGEPSPSAFCSSFCPAAWTPLRLSGPLVGHRIRGDHNQGRMGIKEILDCLECAPKTRWLSEPLAAGGSSGTPL